VHGNVRAEMCPSPRAHMTRLVHEAGLRDVLPRTRGSSLHMQGLRTAPRAAPLCSATCLSFCVSPHRSGCRVVLRIVSQHDTEVAPQDVIVVRRGGRRRFRCRCQVCVGRRRPRWVRQQRRCLQADLEGWELFRGPTRNEFSGQGPKSRAKI